MTGVSAVVEAGGVVGVVVTAFTVEGVVVVTAAEVVVAIAGVDVEVAAGVEEEAASTVFSALEADLEASISLSPTSLKRSSDKSWRA